MLTSGDDYPIHQLPEPVAYATGERNFYDRYFFNGYARDSSLFFAAALGVYPQLGVMDAAFSVVRDGVQRNLRASRSSATLDRMATRVGPIAVEVLEPLRTLALRVASPEHGIAADLVFLARAQAVEEPRFLRRAAGRTLMDLTRLTQHGVWQGHIEIEDRRIPIETSRCWGTRDRSWGIRAVGEPDTQPVPGVERQFYWLWAPLNFDDRVTLFHRNEDGDGRPWTRYAAAVQVDPAHDSSGPRTNVDDIRIFLSPRSTVRLRPGSRHAAAATLFFGAASTGDPDRAGEITIDLEPRFELYMSGLGYLHPEWGHGRNRGELAVGFDAEPLAEVNRGDLLHLHVQALCDARMRLPDGGVRIGQGVLEQLILGRHAPSGLRE
ncbi:MAG TPA: hypothetical protein VMS86_01250 [Thermoanaerobaculia bacterium]|nr:hypothetical protein [Thermoanaerobaculia bacterium]